KKARVAVAGLGGLGSHIAISLARTGVGHLHLIDFDVVEPSNLNRQCYRIVHLGMDKTEALKQEIAEINPYIKVTVETIRVTEKNAAGLFKEDDIVCEAFDQPEAKAMLVNTLFSSGSKKVIVAASGMAGSGSSNTIKTRRIAKGFYLCGDGETAAEAGRGLMAPRVSICAGHQANMVLRIILGEEYLDNE
ncbi:MAG: sulfur carrier protein ThiS adenylyltransferase ThiF, partial [Eubacterium sp.]